MTIERVSAELGICEAEVRRLVEQRRLRAVRVEGVSMVRRADLEEFLRREPGYRRGT